MNLSNFSNQSTQLKFDRDNPSGTGRVRIRMRVSVIARIDSLVLVLLRARSLDLGYHPPDTSPMHAYGDYATSLEERPWTRSVNIRFSSPSRRRLFFVFLVEYAWYSQLSYNRSKEKWPHQFMITWLFIEMFFSCRMRVFRYQIWTILRHDQTPPFISIHQRT